MLTVLDAIVSREVTTGFCASDNIVGTEGVWG